MDRRVLAVIGVVVACVVGAGVYVAIAAVGSGPKKAASLSPGASAGGGGKLDPHLRILVRAVDPNDPRGNGRLYTVAPGGRATPVRGRSCERVAVAGHRIICLYLASTGVDYRAAIIDTRTHSTKVVGLTGLPSRARVSPNGRLGAWTTFVSGDSYTSPGQFSTRTSIVDLTSGSVLADLEQFSVTNNGQVVNAVDRNFWGVTFASDNKTFYATMATGSHHYLIRGNLNQRSATVLRDNMECPSLSPDGTRVGYKYRLSGGRWRLHVLDLATMKDVELAETRSIDDQVDWLDNSTIAYSDGTSLWTVAADGSGSPHLLLRNAASPTVEPSGPGMSGV